MNIVNSGNEFTVYGDEVKTFAQLPADTYQICFNDQKGFFLRTHNDLEVHEKIYGSYKRKVDKVMKTFDALERNMGVILSGPKGVGKSVFARLLAEAGKIKNLPMIIVDRAIPGIDSFISSIEQECIVLFDEFEKRFNNEKGAQEMLLSLFDGIDNGKKLFVITCNETYKLNAYLLNRPGRFHYHFVIDSPDKDDIMEYLEDNLVGDAKKYKDDIVNLAEFNKFTYDILRAICFDLNQGYSLKETLSDLNIERNTKIKVMPSVIFNTGLKATLTDCHFVDWDIERWSTQSVYLTLNLKDEHWPEEIPEDVRYELRFVEFRIPTESIYFEGNNMKVDVDCVNVEFNNSWKDLDSVNKDMERIVDEYLESIRIKSMTIKTFSLGQNGHLTKFN